MATAQQVQCILSMSGRLSSRCTWSISFVSGNRRPVCSTLCDSLSLWAGHYLRSIWT